MRQKFCFQCTLKFSTPLSFFKHPSVRGTQRTWLFGLDLPLRLRRQTTVTLVESVKINSFNTECSIAENRRTFTSIFSYINIRIGTKRKILIIAESLETEILSVLKKSVFLKPRSHFAKKTSKIIIDSNGF